MRMELAFATRGPEYPPPDLRYPDQNACRVISIKPVDIVVVDPSRMVVMVIDSQNSAMRAEVKKEALRKVSVPTIEIVPADGPSNIEVKPKFLL